MDTPPRHIAGKAPPIRLATGTFAVGTALLIGAMSAFALANPPAFSAHDHARWMAARVPGAAAGALPIAYGGGGNLGYASALGRLAALALTLANRRRQHAAIANPA